MEVIEIKDALLGFMAGVASATASDVALVVLDTDWHRAADGVSRLLPMVAVRSGGYAEFPDDMRDQVSQYCGALLPVAETRVEDINVAYGLDPDDADHLVRLSMGEVPA